MAYDIDRIFDYHSPDTETVQNHQAIRTMCKEMAAVILMFENSRERSIALTKLEEMQMWLHAHIARNTL